MIKIYTEAEHPRYEYVFGFIFGSIRRDWVFTDQIQDADVAYCASSPAHSTIWLPQCVDMAELETKASQLYTDVSQVLSGQRDSATVDPIAFAFHALSRMEEYTDQGRDDHDRYKYTESLLYKNDLLHRPAIDELLTLYLGELYNLSSSICYTLDVDTAYQYLGKGRIKNWGLNTKDLLSIRFKKLKARWKVRTGRQIDPYQKNIQDFIEQEPHARKEIFWLVSRDSSYDRQVSLLYRRHPKLIIETNNKQPVSLHASYESYTNQALIEQQRKTLEKIIEKPVTKNRFHYLRLKLPESYRSLQLAGIKEDWTMGYPDYNGFRAATCRPFYWYDLERESQSALKVVPFEYIDLVTDSKVLEHPGPKTKVYHNFESIKLQPS